MSMITPRLYVGDMSAASSLTELQAQGITHVINCTAQPNLELERNAGGVLKYIRLDLHDNTSDLVRMPESFEFAADFIDQGLADGGMVLVYCHRGISRSVTIVLAQLMRELQLSAEKAFEMVRSKRSICDPNLGYWCVLKEWERKVVFDGVSAAALDVDDDDVADDWSVVHGGSLGARTTDVSTTSPDRTSTDRLWAANDQPPTDRRGAPIHPSLDLC